MGIRSLRTERVGTHVIIDTIEVTDSVGRYLTHDVFCEQCDDFPASGVSLDAARAIAESHRCPTTDEA